MVSVAAVIGVAALVETTVVLEATAGKEDAFGLRMADCRLRHCWLLPLIDRVC